MKGHIIINKGVCKLKFSDNYEIMETNQDNERTCTIVEVQSKDKLHTVGLVNTYAPCNKQQQREFFKAKH